MKGKHRIFAYIMRGLNIIALIFDGLPVFGDYQNYQGKSQYDIEEIPCCSIKDYLDQGLKHPFGKFPKGRIGDEYCEKGQFVRADYLTIYVDKSSGVKIISK